MILATATIVPVRDIDTWAAPAQIEISEDQNAKVIQLMKDQGRHQSGAAPYEQYMHDLGAAREREITIDLNLSTRSDQQIRLKNVSIDADCRAPVTGTLFFMPPAGPASPIGKIGFNLDERPSIAREMHDTGEGQAATFGKDFFASHVQYIKKNDGYAYRVAARTSRYSCEFRLKLTATDGIKTETTTIDNNGTPYRVTALRRFGKKGDVDFRAYKKIYARAPIDPKRPYFGWYPQDPNSFP